MRMDDTQRAAFGYHEEHEYMGRFWEPAPDEEDLERLRQAYEASEHDDEPLPFERRRTGT